MPIPLSTEKKELVKKLQEAVGRSPQRLRILKEINKKESIKELTQRLKIPQPNMSKAIARFYYDGHGLIKLISEKGKSPTFDKVPLLKQIGSLDKWVKFDIEETEKSIAPRRIKAKRIIISNVPFIDFKVEQDAKKMAEGPYINLYLLENSMRKFIDAVLSKKHGKDWWAAVVKNKDILKKVGDRKRLEGMHRWHAPRGGHEIYYTDLDDLAYFLNIEKSEFDKYLDVELWTTLIKKIVKLSRNIVDHHNPLPTREINRLKELLEDWKRQMRDKTV